jgi:hypothetical protein
MSLAATVACGSGGSGSIVLPNPSGITYSNASLKGSYVYQVHGFDTSGNPYRQVGVFSADGNGTITGGSDDSIVNATGTAVTGNYSVATDGTGFINLNTSLGQISWAITLSSTSEFSLIEADTFANAGGTAELQPPSAISATLSGTYVFRLHQEFSAQNQTPAAEVGAITLSGGSATGSMDENLNGVFSSPAVTATYSTPDSLGRGTGTLVNSSTNFTTNFVYYIVDISKFVMLVSNVNAVGSGSAELQSGAVTNGLSGNYAFGSRGDGSFFAGVATVGQISAASGTMTTTEDLNQDGTITSNTSFDSCYTPSANGRVVINDVSGNACSSSAAQVFWMVNPSRAVFVNTFSIEDGTADLQTSPSFSTSTFTQQYAMAMDGLDLSRTIVPSDELYSRIGVLQFDGKGNLKLNEVVNASGTNAGVNSPGILGGTYSVGSNGRITGSVGNGTLNLVMYAVSPSQAYVLQADPGFITSGTLLLQQ